MAKFYATGKLCQVKTKNGGYVGFSIKEGNYKDKTGEWQTSWFNFLVKEQSVTAKFLQTNWSKIDVIEVTGDESQTVRDGIQNTYHTNINVRVVTWKKQEQGSNEAQEKQIVEDKDVIELDDSELPI